MISTKVIQGQCNQCHVRYAWYEQRKKDLASARCLLCGEPLKRFDRKSRLRDAWAEPIFMEERTP